MLLGALALMGTARTCLLLLLATIWASAATLQSRGQEEYARIVGVSAPPRAFTRSTFEVNVTISYVFTLGARETAVGIWEYTGEGKVRRAITFEVLFGEGERTYTLNLTAPKKPMLWNLTAEVWFFKGAWGHSRADWLRNFTVVIVEEPKSNLLDQGAIAAITTTVLLVAAAATILIRRRGRGQSLRVPEARYASLARLGPMPESHRFNCPQGRAT